MNKAKSKKPKAAAVRKFPIRCINCGQVEVHPTKISYDTAKNYDGKLYRLHVPDLHVNQCRNCKEIYFGADADEQINAALRDELALLTPEQIRNNLDALNLNQKDAAERLGIAQETLSRWLTGAIIQSRAMDNLLRVFFGCIQARKHLSGAHQDRGFGTSIAAVGTAKTRWRAVRKRTPKMAS